MMFIAGNRTRVFAVVVISIFLATVIAPAWAQESTAKYTYDMTFDHDGFTTINILYNSGTVGSGASWVAIPKNFTETTTLALQGTITSVKRAVYQPEDAAGAHPFYDNLTFSYTSDDRPFSMRLRFNMTGSGSGAMIVEPNGFFYSPLIAVPSSASVEAVLTFPDGVESLDEIQPTPARVDISSSRPQVFFNLLSESRVAVTFTVSWAQETSHIREGKVEADVPSRYLDLGTSMVRLYESAIPLMDDLFNSTVDRISMKFFAPSTLPQLTIGGYTPIDPSSFQAGTIYLNLFYFRAQSGTMETIAIHELTHQYEARIGISPELLWVQEGLANYVAVQMGNLLGYDAGPTAADLETAAGELGGNYGMIQYWRPGGTIVSLFRYYAASYEVFKTLGDKHGGLSLYSSFFRELAGLKDGLKSTNVAVYELSLAARTNLAPQFTAWGFELLDLSIISARIAKLRAEAELCGPLLPFREQALSHLKLAQDSLYSSPEAAAGHVTIAAFYIETIPMIIGGVVVFIILLVVVAVVANKRSKRKQAGLDSSVRYQFLSRIVHARSDGLGLTGSSFAWNLLPSLPSARP
jgi:hypothetical protein